MSTLGDMLARRRGKLGLTLREMERRSGLSNPYLCQVETGKTGNPTILNAVAISHAYGIAMRKIIAAIVADQACDRGD
jgi:transcriptional regulator with XRE-family HTH domain